MHKPIFHAWKRLLRPGGVFLCFVLLFLAGIMLTANAAATVYNFAGITASTGAPETVRDEFNTVSYSNNDGTLNWVDDWIESDNGGSSGALDGAIQISGGELRLTDGIPGRPNIVRAVDLSTYSQAFLSFDFHTTADVDPNDRVRVEIRREGSFFYQSLETFAGSDSGSRHYDIGNYLSADANIRFRIVQNYEGANEYFFVDNVQISLTPSCAAGEICAHASDVDRFPYQNAWNRNTFVQATAPQYLNISADNTAEWETADPDVGDEIFVQFDMIMTEEITAIMQIDLTFNGNTDGDFLGNPLQTGHTLYAKRWDRPWYEANAWVQIGPTEQITADVDTEMTRSITANFADYINPASGAITWGVYEDRHSENMRINYAEMVVITNDPPVAVDDTGVIDEDTVLNVDTTSGVLSNDSDPNTHPLTVTTFQSASVLGATVVVNANGSYTYDPTGVAALQALATGELASDAFTYTTGDGYGGTATATVTITVNGRNDDPLIENASFLEPLPIAEGDGVTLAGAFSDIDAGDVHTATVAWGDGRSDTISLGTGVEPFTAPHTYNDNGTFTTTLALHDGHDGVAQTSLAVQVSNVAPQVDAGPDQSVDVDTAVALSGHFTDPGSADTHTIMWDFGDGNDDNGTLNPTHTYAFPGVYTVTLTVTDDDNGSGSDSASITVLSSHPPSPLYLPAIFHDAAMVDAPDLVVTGVRANHTNVEVVIKNIGNVPATEPFWVDFYVNPNPVPTQVEQLWQEVASEGIAWGVTNALAAGESLTLTYSILPGTLHPYYIPEQSHFSGSWPTGTPIYAQVDSANLDTVYGGVLESHEITNGIYNNVSEMATLTAEPFSVGSTVDVPPLDLSTPLPRRVYTPPD